MNNYAGRSQNMTDIEHGHNGWQDSQVRTEEGFSQFRLPPSTQAESGLFKLPQELRLMIMRELLYSREPLAYTPTPEAYAARLRAPRWDFSWEDYQYVMHPNFTFWPRILGTCQLLHIEGHHVLYAKNTLSIHIRLNVPRVWTILNEQADISLGVVNGPTQLISQLLDKIDKPVDPWNPHSRWAYQNVLYVSKHIQNLKLAIHTNAGFINPLHRHFTDKLCSENLLGACNWFSCALEQKNVSIIIYISPEEWDSQYAEALREALKCQRLNITTAHPIDLS